MIENLKEPSLIEEEQAVRVVRDKFIAERIVFIGGLPACGKSMMAPILGGFDRVEIQKYNYMIEHICSLRFLGKISEEAASVIIRMQTDLDLYHMMMARETNFRHKDLSSIFQNPNPWRYIRRLFRPGNAEAVERIRRERPILQILTHNLLMHAIPLVRALGNRACMVEGVRHPLYMIKQWYLYIDQYGNDPRDFNIWIDHKGHSLPFFTKGWEDQYICSNKIDRVIYSIQRSLEFCQLAFNGMTGEEQSRVLIVPFEQFVINPWPFMKKIESLLGTKMIKATYRELKSQNVPRKMYATGIGKSIYKYYGWRPPQKGASEAQELTRRRQYVLDMGASREGMQVLDQLSTQYEDQYMKDLVI